MNDENAMKQSLSAILCATLLLGRAMAAEAPPRLAGGFIQLQGWMNKLTPEDWRREIDAMHRLGMTTIVIQYLQYNDVSLIPEDPTAVDPTGTILKLADDRGMTVFLGTAAEDGWWKWDADYLRGALERRRALTRKIVDRYGSHRSFAGWYFTEEASGFMSPEKTRQLRDYFRALSDHCKALREQPVAFAPFFSDLTPLEEMRRIYSELLDGAGIDIMMVQDGVGARGWDDALEAKVPPFFAMFRDVCRQTGVRLWCDLESFEREDPEKEFGFIPTEIERLERQLKAVAPYVEQIVTFDFFHYLSPYRGERQRALYEGYCRYLGIEPVVETAEGSQP